MRTSQQGKPTGANNSGPQHGLGSGLGGSAGQRLPVPPRERKPALAALAVLLILGGALVSAYLVVQSGQRVSAIAVATPIAAGERIPESALKAVTVSDTGVAFIRWSERTKVTRGFAAVPLVPNTLLNNDMITEVEDGAKGRLIVGLSLKPGQFPAGGVELGQRLALYSVTGGEKNPTRAVLLAADALVREVVALGGLSREKGGPPGELRVTVAVLPEQAPNITLAAAAGNVAVAIVPPGSQVPVPKAGGQTQTGGG
ncbi:hypothetical protein LO762_28405 [Actinocorallia sp. API 0066]|uniref:hypothetical protein n=1 Tax=Actinocorallia sp. API 0066 TaxID=2896846 RepID=UPI001E3E557B|nr:hypothetical protein [Actinocorallia sp. API 0066]MCD0453075.1 hypothetical protein [Actinocorallia sp. API 0066]